MRISIKRSIKVSKIIYLKNLTTELKNSIEKFSSGLHQAEERVRFQRQVSGNPLIIEKGKEMKKVKIE